MYIFSSHYTTLSDCFHGLQCLLPTYLLKFLSIDVFIKRLIYKPSFASVQFLGKKIKLLLSLSL